MLLLLEIFYPFFHTSRSSGKSNGMEIRRKDSESVTTSTGQKEYLNNFGIVVAKRHCASPLVTTSPFLPLKAYSMEMDSGCHILCAVRTRQFGK